MNKLILLFFLTITIRQSVACELCGCSSGNYFIGPFPQFNSHFVGMRYSFQQFGTILRSDNSQFSNDFYQSSELMAGTRIRNQWQFLLFLPFNVNRTSSDDGNKQIGGMGDLTLMGNYDLINRKAFNRDSVTFLQQLWVGAGVKLPTGQYTVDADELVPSANMQPGTGSLDFLVNAIYIFQIERWGFNLSTNYKINQSADNFKFGNRFTATSFVFRSLPVSKVTMSPNMGLLYESLGASTNDGEKMEDTGGNALLSALGMEIRFRRIAWGVNAQIPLWSDLSGGQTDAKMRGMCHLFVIF